MSAVVNVTHRVVCSVWLHDAVHAFRSATPRVRAAQFDSDLVLDIFWIVDAPGCPPSQ